MDGGSPKGTTSSRPLNIYRLREEIKHSGDAATCQTRTEKSKGKQETAQTLWPRLDIS